MIERWAISIGLVLLWGAPALAKDIALTFGSPPAKTTTAQTPRTDAVNLSFTPKPSTQPTDTSLPKAPITQIVRHTLDALFHGGSHSLVARAGGSAEGTRTPDGGYTAAYDGHVDPGNQKWNLGSFSYQHGATTPAAADAKQLKRLYNQALTLRQQAHHHQVTLSLEEELNGIDLANQAPLAALDRGYIDWLAVAKQQSMAERDRILWARTHAFLDPDSGYWDAPGLGNTLNSIRWDQARRQQAVQQAIELNQ
ncbi:MAG: hypothetical protein AAF572_18435 [Cyanobacteria bacterium P01_B01_bin.77]